MRFSKPNFKSVQSYSRQHHLTAYLGLLCVLAVTLSVQEIRRDNQYIHANSLGGRVLEMSDTMESRIAKRLQKRLYNHYSDAPHLLALTSAVKQRQQYFRRNLEVQLIAPDGSAFEAWNVSLQGHPLWLKSEFTQATARYSIDEEAIAEYLTTQGVPGTTPPVHAMLTGVYEQEDGIIRAEIEGRGVSGIGVDAELVSQQIAQALHVNQPELTVQLEEQPGRLINLTGQEMGNLELLGSGRSNYRGSTWGRKKNVEKALNEHVDSIVIEPGATFSFNDSLGGPVTLSRGWTMAKVIFGGSELRPAPGGGICQASTTTYRAAVDVGLPVSERKAHSLYVSYYKEYGVGIDATIFPGVQDLVFTNDTGHHLVIQAYNDGYDAYVNVFGTPDGRTVELAGPYFDATAPDDLRVHDRRLKKNEVAWVHSVHYPSGEKKESVILSRYQTLPRYVKNEYIAKTLHAAAGNEG